VLVNGLGTTETGIVRQFFVSRDTQLEDGLLPVGYAVPDVDVFIATTTAGAPARHLRGNIVESRFLAVGYWKDPQRTADKFKLVDGKRGERSYRTGDLGRMGADGCLEHLGAATTSSRFAARAWIPRSSKRHSSAFQASLTRRRPSAVVRTANASS
jgi:non-ribosomal peptide synthetase component F